MDLRYIGTYNVCSGKIVICDPFLTRVNIDELSNGLSISEDDYRRYVTVKKGVYNMYTSLYLSDTYKFCSSHVVFINSEAGDGLVFDEKGLRLPLIMNDMISVCDVTAFDNPDFSYYSVESGAIYYKKHVRELAKGIIMGPLECLSSDGDYVTGESLENEVSGVVRLANRHVLSNHWYHDVAGRCMNGMGAAAYYGGCVAACEDSSCMVRLIRSGGEVCGGMISLGHYKDDGEYRCAKKVFEKLKG